MAKGKDGGARKAVKKTASKAKPKKTVDEVLRVGAIPEQETQPQQKRKAAPKSKPAYAATIKEAIKIAGVAKKNVFITQEREDHFFILTVDAKKHIVPKVPEL